MTPRPRKWTALGLLLCASACSTTQTPPPDPLRAPAWLKPVAVESPHRSRDDLMQDPTATPLDTDKQLILTEQALRLANSIIIRTREWVNNLEIGTDEQRGTVPRPDPRP